MQIEAFMRTRLRAPVQVTAIFEDKIRKKLDTSEPVYLSKGRY